MKKINQYLIISSLAVSLAFCLVGPSAAFAATSPTLSGASSYSVLGGSTVTNTGSTTTTGAVGVSAGTAITGFPPGVAGGGTHSNDSSAIAAQTDNLAAFGTLNQGCDHSYSDGQDLTLLSPLGPGVYCSAGSFALSGNLTLTGSGVWIFKSASTLITSSNSSVTGGDPCNVWWRVGSSATLGTTSSLIGNIFALTSVTFNTGATLGGRALAQNGAVTLDTNTISGPTCAPTTGTLHIIKHVITDNGGSAVASAFTINVAGTNVSSSSFAGSEAGTDITLDAGSYAVTEPTVPTGYLESGSGTCSGTIIAGQTITCTITNDDIAPQLIVNKVIVNDNGGTKLLPANFTFFIDGSPVISGVTTTTTIGAHTVSETADSGYTTVISGNCASNGTITLALGDVKTCTITNDDIAQSVSSGGGSGSYGISTPIAPLIDVVKVPSPLALPNGPGPVTYTYTLRNIGAVPVSNVTMVGDTCSPIILISGDTNGDSKLDVSETWVYKCSTTLSVTHTNIVTATGIANGITATDIASATVVVGLPVVPPLIHVTKVPNPLALPAGNGVVTYTNKVTNPGTVALSNIQINDDKCSPLQYISGDTNNDSKLDVIETWTYTCKTTLFKTTTNTVTASGQANGLTATDFAIATVIVSAPSFPNTGLPDASGFGQQVRAIAINLGQGSGGNNVILLQQFLISQDKGSAARALSSHGTTTYFGLLTRGALAEFQASVGISPALGNFGPITRAYLKTNY